MMHGRDLVCASASSASTILWLLVCPSGVCAAASTTLRDNFGFRVRESIQVRRVLKELAILPIEDEYETGMNLCDNASA